jgi:hypothetical protein
MRHIALILLLLLATAPARAAGSHAGATPFDFLFLDAGARQAALGGTYAAGRNDPNVLSYNPAGLAVMSEHKAAFMHENRFGGVTRDHLAVASGGGLGMAVDHLKYGSIQRTTLSRPDGSGLDSFSPSSLSVALGYGGPLSDVLNGGIAVKLIRESIDDINAQGLALDLGVQGTLLSDPGILVGLAVQNIGGPAKFQTVRTPLPLNIKAGMAVSFEPRGWPLNLSADINHAPGGITAYNMGVATALLQRVIVRTGFNSRNDAGLGVTFGFGLVFDRFHFDYAVLPSGDLGAAHMMTIGVKWGRPDSGGGEIEEALDFFPNRRKVIEVQ